MLSITFPQRFFKMVKLIFVHGWGFDASFWNDTIDALDGVESSCLDLGFFGPEQISFEGDDIVFVTHSMGLAWVLNNVHRPLKGVISINGFTKFCSAEGWPSGVAPRMLQRMIRQFGKNPEAVWSDFMVKCGLIEPKLSKHADHAALLEGLKNLGEWDVRESFASLECPTLLLSATDDLIVPTELSQDSFGQAVEWCEGANHLLPLQRAPFIASQIRSFVEKLT